MRDSPNDQQHEAEKSDRKKEADDSAGQCNAGAYDDFTHRVLNSVS